MTTSRIDLAVERAPASQAAGHRRRGGAGARRDPGGHPARRPAGCRGRRARRAGDRAQRAEWRCDPTSAARLPQATGDDAEWVVLCSQGYTWSLAAAALQDLGLHRATDVAGGYQALVASDYCA